MLIFLDIDGTLVGTGGEVSANVWQAAEPLREAGARLAVCTGRPCAGVAEEIAHRLDPAAPHVFLNGALVRTAPGELLELNAIPADVLDPLIAASRRWNVTLELYTPDADYVDALTPECRRHAEAVGVEPIARDLEEVAAELPVLKAQWIVGGEFAERAESLEAPGCIADISTSPVMPDLLDRKSVV